MRRTLKLWMKSTSILASFLTLLIETVPGYMLSIILQYTTPLARSSTLLKPGSKLSRIHSASSLRPTK